MAAPSSPPSPLRQVWRWRVRLADRPVEGHRRVGDLRCVRRPGPERVLVVPHAEARRPRVGTRLEKALELARRLRVGARMAEEDEWLHRFWRRGTRRSNMHAIVPTRTTCGRAAMQRSRVPREPAAVNISTVPRGNAPGKRQKAGPGQSTERRHRASSRRRRPVVPAVQPRFSAKVRAGGAMRPTVAPIAARTSDSPASSRNGARQWPEASCARATTMGPNEENV